jgi:NADP-dependent 3-hydroxy acid dehydrogenase YdfG
MVREVRDQVVVLTGASSGIGRETALAFASARAGLVLAARDREALDNLVAEVQRLGGRAVGVPTDVTDFGQVEALAVEAVRRFGRVDTWVDDHQRVRWPG